MATLHFLIHAFMQENKSTEVFPHFSLKQIILTRKQVNTCLIFFTQKTYKQKLNAPKTDRTELPVLHIAPPLETMLVSLQNVAKLFPC